MIKTPEQAVAEVKAETTIQDDEYRKLFDYQQAKDEIKYIVSSWITEIEETESRRSLRNIDIDIEQERNAGTIKQDETFIPVRLVDSNIRKEQPPFISYLTQSRRLAIFRSQDNSEQDTLLLEKAFTEGMTYEGWEVPLIKTLDGAQTHGWDLVEVVFDATKPLNVGIEHIGHDRLIFNKDTINIQFAPRLMRKYDVTLAQLKSFSLAAEQGGFGFSLDQVNKLVDVYRERRDKSTVEIYKVLFKWQGIVYVAWCSKEAECDDWLKSPAKLYLGIRHKETRMETQMQTQMMPVSIPSVAGPPMQGSVPQQVPVQVPVEVWVDSDINMYPVFFLPYSTTEVDKIFEHKGRVFLDEFKQEAMTAVITALVNGTTRASSTYASVEADDGTSAQVKQLQNLEPGTILNKALKFFHQDYPDPTVIRVLEYLQTLSTEETGQIAWSVQNRQDSRKTATEIQAAQEQTSLLNSVQLVLFSTFIRAVYGFCWKIVQSQALQDKIKFLQVSEILVKDPMTGQEVSQPLPQPVNDYKTIAQNYDVRAAGDVDVVQRADKLQRMMQLWPMVSATPLGLKFLEEILRNSFPEDAEKWIVFMNTALQAQQQMQQQANMMLQQQSKQSQQNPS